MALSHLRNLLLGLALPAGRVDVGELVVPYINILLQRQESNGYLKMVFVRCSLFLYLLFITLCKLHVYIYSISFCYTSDTESLDEAVSYLNVCDQKKKKKIERAYEFKSTDAMLTFVTGRSY